jgi:hypothetical protein
MAEGQATFKVYAWTAILDLTKKVKLSLCLVSVEENSLPVPGLEPQPCSPWPRHNTDSSYLIWEIGMLRDRCSVDVNKTTPATRPV